MSVPSIFVILLLLSSSLSSSPGAPINPNDIIRESINNAAGMELIPMDAKFKLTEFRGEYMHNTKTFPDGGYGSVSGSAYTGKFADVDNGANSNSNKFQMVIPISIISLTWTLLTLKQ